MNRIDQSHRRKLSKTNQSQSTEHRQTTRLSDIALLCEEEKSPPLQWLSLQLEQPKSTTSSNQIRRKIKTKELHLTPSVPLKYEVQILL